MTEPTSQSIADDATETTATATAGGPGPDVSTSVVMALADARDTDPLELEDPLHDWIDPDALDALVASLERGHVEFAVDDRHVRVDADGSVSVTDPR